MSAPPTPIVLSRGAPDPAQGPGQRDSELGLWLGLGVTLVALAVAAWFARRRSKREEEAPRRFLRIFCSAAGFGCALALLLGADYAANPRRSLDVWPEMAIGAAVFAVIGIVLFGILDFWLGLFRPRRSRRWLAAAILAFALLVVGSLALAFWIAGESESLFQADLLQIVGIAASAGIIWWSYLPAPRRDVAGLFE